MRPGVRELIGKVVGAHGLRDRASGSLRLLAKFVIKRSCKNP